MENHDKAIESTVEIIAEKDAEIAKTKSASECGGAVMGKEARRELTIIPAQVMVTEHIREVAAPAAAVG